MTNQANNRVLIPTVPHSSPVLKHELCDSTPLEKPPVTPIRKLPDLIEMADNSSLDAVLPTLWQLWDLILSHLHDAPTSRMIVEGTHKGVSQLGGTYTNHDFYYAMDNPQHATISYVRLQDNLDRSILQNHILPPLDCLENQIEVLASLLIQRFEERGLWYGSKISRILSLLSSVR